LEETEIGNSKLETGDWKLEIGNSKFETRNWKRGLQERKLVSAALTNEAGMCFRFSDIASADIAPIPDSAGGSN
jgi:hypothetical protein